MPNTMSEALQWLHRFGHNYNKQYQNSFGIDETSVKKMLGTESDAKDMIKSFQESDLNVALEFERRNRREHEPDGELDPVTMAVMEFPRCAMPDFAPPPGARFSTGDTDLDGAIASQQIWGEEQERIGATGTGSWPVGCDPQFPNVHSVVVQMDTSGASAAQKEKLQEILKFTIACEAEIGQHVRVVLDQAVTPRAHHKVTYGPIPGSTIGFAYFPTPNSCNQTVTAKIDSTFNVSAITAANLHTHEWKGHSDGLNHTRGGIMNPSIITFDPLSWLKDNSFPVKKRYFGGEPLVVIPVPGGQLVFRNGVFYVNNIEVGKLTVSPGGVTYVEGDIKYGGVVSGRMIMIPPA